MKTNTKTACTPYISSWVIVERRSQVSPSSERKCMPEEVEEEEASCLHRPFRLFNQYMFTHEKNKTVCPLLLPLPHRVITRDSSCVLSASPSKEPQRNDELRMTHYSSKQRRYHDIFPTTSCNQKLERALA